MFASDQDFRQKQTFIFKAICRNVRIWASFWSPDRKLASGLKAGGRRNLQTNRLWWPHAEGKRAFIPCAVRLLGQQERPDGLRAALQSTQQVTELLQGTGPLGTVSRPRQHWHPGSCRVLGVVLPVWAQIPSRGAWQ